MDQRETRLVAERQDLDRVRSEIEKMRGEIDERAIAIKADEQKTLKSLAKTYSNLTATAAVAIIREMDDTTLVKILYLMKPEDVGKIFRANGRHALAGRHLYFRALFRSNSFDEIRSVAHDPIKSMPVSARLYRRPEEPPPASRHRGRSARSLRLPPARPRRRVRTPSTRCSPISPNRRRPPLPAPRPASPVNRPANPDSRPLSRPPTMTRPTAPLPFSPPASRS